MYIGWDNREYEDPEMDAMQEDARQARQEPSEWTEDEVRSHDAWLSTQGQAQFGLEYAQEHIQQIEAGSETLHVKVERIEYQLVMLLEDLINVLPPAFRAQAHACYATRNRLREAFYADLRVQFPAQHKTSPESLAATDSF